MIIPCRIDVISVANDMRLLYAIYMCKDAEGVIQYIGVTPLSELLTLDDAFCNNEFTNMFGKPLTALEIVCEHLTPSENEAYQTQRLLISQHNPYCNRHGYYQAKRNQFVRCDQTGETFRNATEAAKHHNLTPSALSNHLKRKPGHKTVKGRTYSYTTKWD